MGYRNQQDSILSQDAVRLRKEGLRAILSVLDHSQ